MKKIALAFALVLIPAMLFAITHDYFNWRSASVDSSVGVTCTVITSTSQRIAALDILNSGTEDIYLDVGGDNDTVTVSSSAARLAPNDTLCLEEIQSNVKTIGFKTSTGTGTVEVHALLYDWGI